MKLLKKESFILLFLGFVCLFFFFFQLGSYRLIDVDEPRYAEAAREMIESWNWITPYFNYELRFDKPIFFYWLIALSYLVFGVTEFAARFPSALLATALVFFTYYFGRKTISKSFGFISAIILATNLEFIALARMSITDMTLGFFICATIISGFLGVYSEEKNKKCCWWWLAYLFSGIAVLTKGPIGFAIPALIFGIYFTLTGTLKEALRPKFVIPGIIIFLLTVIPWYYEIISIHGRTFVDYFFLKHNFARFASSNFKQHHQPFYFYFIVLIAGFFPWSIYFISSIYKHIKELLNHITNQQFSLRKLDFAIYKNADNRLKVILFTTVWFFTIFILFSMSKAKLLTYIISLFPAVSLLTGIIWYEYIAQDKNSKTINVSAKLLTGFCTILSLVILLAFNLILPRDEKLAEQNYVRYILSAIFFCVPLITLYFINKRQKVKAFVSITLLIAGLIIAAITTVIPAIYRSGQEDLVNYCNIIKTLNIQDKKLATYGLVKPSIVFYSQQKWPYIEDNDFHTLSKFLNDKKPAFIIVRSKRLKVLSGNVKFNLINRGAKFSLISNYKLQDMKER